MTESPGDEQAGERDAPVDPDLGVTPADTREPGLDRRRGGDGPPAPSDRSPPRGRLRPRRGRPWLGPRREGRRAAAALGPAGLRRPLRDDLGPAAPRARAWYAGALSPQRDLEVFAGALASATDDVHGFDDALLPWLHRRQVIARDSALEELRSPRADTLRRTSCPSRRAPSFTGAAARKAPKVLRPRVLRADRHAARLLERLRPGRRPGPLALGAHRRQARPLRRRGGRSRPRSRLRRAGAPLGEPHRAARRRAGRGDPARPRPRPGRRPRRCRCPRARPSSAVCSSPRPTTARSTCHRRARDVWKSSREQHAHLRKALGQVGRCLL